MNQIKSSDDDDDGSIYLSEMRSKTEQSRAEANR
jgi:hypothetical protein